MLAAAVADEVEDIVVVVVVTLADTDWMSFVD